MSANKYDELNNPAKEASVTTAINNYVPSKEHIRPITPFVTYTTDKKSNALVRIYDGIIAKRDDTFLVERKELIGKTPEAIEAYFGLAFTPRFLCDASVPVENKILMGKLTNAAGQKVSIFKALTALDLFSERPLIPENIPPTR